MDPNDMAEQSIRERAERYALVLAGSDAAIWDWDVPAKRVLYSPRWRELRGLSEDEVTDSEDEWAKRIHPEDAPRVLAAVHAHFEGRTTVFAEEYRVQHKLGHWVWIQDRGIAQRDARGTVTRMAGSETDITARKQAEEALRESERRYRAMVEGRTEMVCRFRPDGTILFVNGAYARSRGTTPEAIAGANFWEFIPVEDRPAVRELLGRLTPSEPEIRIENRFVTADGDRWTLWANRAIAFDADGCLLEAQSTGIDITERKRAEQALRESEAFKSAMFETALDCIISMDHEGKVVEFNPAAERTFGHRREDALGRELADLIIPPALRERHREGLARYLATGEGPVLGRRMEMTATHAGGSEFPVELSVTRIPREPPIFTAYLRDITDRKKAEEALRAADRAKDEFLATLSHELRNPLAPLRNSLELLRRADAGGAAAQSIQDIMERQVNHLVRLVEDLMELSRITRGKLELRREPLELQVILRNALETAKPLIDSGGHILHVRLPQEPVHLEGDAIRLAQIFANLLNNAAKYTPAGGEIVLEAHREASMVTVTVSDTGEGIDPTLLPRLFEMFSQGDRTSRRSQSGLGIGLALARRLAEMHDGSIHAESAGVGQGSRFTVRLPIGTTAVSNAKKVEQIVSRSAPHRVLVVDDNEDAATTLGMLLNFLGADVRVVNDGPSALVAFDAYRPHIVLLDIGMPGMNGFQVARAIRAHEKGAHVPIVALTGWGQEEDRRRTKEAGFDYHLTKPADIEALQKLLGSLPEP